MKIFKEIQFVTNAIVSLEIPHLLKLGTSAQMSI